MYLHRLRYLVCGCILIGQSLSIASAPASLETAVKTLNTASREVVIAMPVLRIFEIADKLRVLILSRGVTVYALTGRGSACDSASYWESLQRIGMKLRVVESVRGYAITVDRKYHMTGDELGRYVAPEEPLTLQIERGAVAQQAAARALVTWQSGQTVNCIREGK